MPQQYGVTHQRISLDFGSLYWRHHPTGAPRAQSTAPDNTAQPPTRPELQRKTPDPGATLQQSYVRAVPNRTAGSLAARASPFHDGSLAFGIAAQAGHTKVSTLATLPMYGHLRQASTMGSARAGGMSACCRAANPGLAAHRLQGRYTC